LFKLDTRDTRIRDRTGTRTQNVTDTAHSEWGGKGSYTYSGERQDNDWIKNAKYSGDSSWYNGSTRDRTASFAVSTVDTNKNEDENKRHAELAGRVKPTFKSDYSPRERMTAARQTTQTREKPPTPAPAPAAIPPPAPPPLPPMPALPAI